MAELKTKVTTKDPTDFLNTIEPEQKRADGLALLELFEKVTGEKAVMWGDSIVGFGKYHYKRSLKVNLSSKLSRSPYKSERSTQEGDWPLVGFSPRKQNLTLYIMHGNQDNPDLKKLGKHKTSAGSCLYLNRLSDVDQKVLTQLIATSYAYMKTKQ